MLGAFVGGVPGFETHTVHVVSIADTAAAGGLFDTGEASEEFMRKVEARHEGVISRLADDVERRADAPSSERWSGDNPSFWSPESVT